MGRGCSGRGVGSLSLRTVVGACFSLLAGVSNAHYRDLSPSLSYSLNALSCPSLSFTNTPIIPPHSQTCVSFRTHPTLQPAPEHAHWHSPAKPGQPEHPRQARSAAGAGLAGTARERAEIRAGSGGLVRTHPGALAGAGAACQDQDRDQDTAPDPAAQHAGKAHESRADDAAPGMRPTARKKYRHARCPQHQHQHRNHPTEA